MIKIISLVGARPQFVKMATINRQLEDYKNIKHVIVHTGQHYDNKMSAVFFNEMQIPEPAYNLDINNLSHGSMTGRMIEKIEKVLLSEKPSVLILYGDTNSTLAGSLAAKKLHIDIAHVEAGLRSFNMDMPEEINRIITDRISDFLYCPSKSAYDNLIIEGFDNFPCKKIISGDVMYDAAIFYSKLSNKKADVSKVVNQKEEFILCTIHREENIDIPQKLTSLIEAINEISKEKRVILPLHPRSFKMISKLNLKIKAVVTPPLSYFTMIELLKRCSLVMTDSGGLQKEAYFFNKHCITLREETEWTELVDLNVNMLVGSDKNRILETYYNVLKKNKFSSKKIYGDGNAAKLICDHLISNLI